MVQHTVRGVLVVAIVLTTVIASPIATPVNAMPGQLDSNEQSAHFIPPEPNEQATTTQARLAGQKQQLSTGSTLVVEKGNPSNYDTIQSAIDNATDGDTIEVRSGTYRESVDIDNTITLTASDDVIINPDSSLVGITITGGAAPVISGVTIVDADDGVRAEVTSGNWTIQNVNISGSGSEGIAAFDSNGDWTIRDTTISNAEAAGVDAGDSTGDWTIQNTTITRSGSSGFSSTPGVAADSSTGNWTIQDVTITDIDWDGIDASDTEGNWVIRNTSVTNTAGTGIDGSTSNPFQGGNWTIQNVSITAAGNNGVTVTNSPLNWTIRDTSITDIPRTEYTGSGYGVDAEFTTGSWTMRNTTITNSSASGLDATDSSGDWTMQSMTVAHSGSAGVVARSTDGAWRIHQSTIKNNTQTQSIAASGIDATLATIQGNATQNWWGDASGPSDTDCVGNVDCSNWLTSPPDGMVSGNETANLSVTLSPAELQVTETTSISVTVTDESGTPVAGATVGIGELDVSATTNASGKATLSLGEPAPGEYEVTASAEGYTDATATLTVETDSAPTDPTQRVLQIAGKSNPSDLTQDDVTATITRFNRGQSVNNIDINQDDVTATITLFERN